MKFIALLCFFLSIHFFMFPALSIMKVADIRPGMEGEGRTIFKGTKIETFRFKVLGLMDNIVAAKRSMILVELEGPVLAETGVIAGMSGSPLYIDGKIIGAVAYGFSFSKKPIAGVTPIEDIIETSEYNTPTFTIDVTAIKAQFTRDTIEEIKQLIQKQLTARCNFSPAKELTPIQLLFTQKGISSEALSILKPLGVSVGQATGKITEQTSAFQKDLLEINPGDAVSIPLIKGDFEYSAAGTVTCVDGKNIYLFGHPFFNLGTVRFPLHKASVVTVMPSYDSSFKLTQTLNMVGAVFQDRSFAVQGELGAPLSMIPMKVFIGSRNRNFNLEMVDHPLLTPVLAYVSLNSILTSEFQLFGFQSIHVKGKIYIENEKNINFDDIYNGIYSFDEFTGLIMAINAILLNNKEKSIKIQKIDFEIDGSEVIKKADIENVIINKNSFYPDEPITVDIFMKNERGRTFKESVEIKAPNLKAGSEFYLLVADKDEMYKFDSKNVKSTFFPPDVGSLVRIINNLRKNNRLYIKIISATQGLYIKGYEYSSMPHTLLNMFSFNSASNDQSDIRFSSLSEYQLEVPSVITGRKFFKLNIRER